MKLNINCRESTTNWPNDWLLTRLEKYMQKQKVMDYEDREITGL